MLPDISTATLHIGEQRTVVSTERGDGSLDETILEIGSRKIAAEHFLHHPPTSAEIENAIVAIEDEIARVRPASALRTLDASIRRIAGMAGLPDTPEPVLSRDAVERLFERQLAGPMSDGSLFPTLLILREFMHHKQFSSIAIGTSAG